MSVDYIIHTVISPKLDLAGVPEGISRLPQHQTFNRKTVALVLSKYFHVEEYASFQVRLLGKIGDFGTGLPLREH